MLSSLVKNRKSLKQFKLSYSKSDVPISYRKADNNLFSLLREYDTLNLSNYLCLFFFLEIQLKSLSGQSDFQWRADIGKKPCISRRIKEICKLINVNV